MRIAIYHGYELTGSGSNEYTRYLSRALRDRGHEVHVLCREPDPEGIEHCERAFAWDPTGNDRAIFERPSSGPGSCTIHQLPHGEIRPVYVTDKRRAGNVRTFSSLTDEELDGYHQQNVELVTAVLRKHPVDLIHANHLVYQPVVCAEVAEATGIPYIVYPHGSSIEYTLRQDERYVVRAGRGLRGASGIVSGSHEVLRRILDLYPAEATEFQEKTRIVGVGVDTTLFHPVPRSERVASVQPLLDLPATSGRGPENQQQLEQELRLESLGTLSTDHGTYDPAVPDRDLADKLQRVSWDDPVALYVGALTSGKGIQSLLAALPWLIKDQPQASLLIVGSGAYREVLEAFLVALRRQDEPLLEAIVSRGFDLDRNELTGPWEDVLQVWNDPATRDSWLSAGPAAADRIHFLGRLSHDRLCHLFPCADVAVFPSLVPEAYPLVLMECLSNGVLPLVSDFSGFAEGLADLVAPLGETWVSRMKLPIEPQGRVQHIAQSLASTLGDPALHELAPRLRNVAVNRYDWKVRAEQMERAYGELLLRATAS